MIIPYATPSAGAVLAGLGSSIGNRNRLVNGDMQVDQANAGAAVSVNSTAGTFYSVDKWKGLGSTTEGVYSLQRSAATPPPGFTNFLRATVTTAAAAPVAGSTYFVRQSIEGFSIPDFQYGTATALATTISFWARASITGAFSGSVRNGGATRSYPFSFSIASANVWQFVTVTLLGDITGTWAVDATTGLTLAFDLGSGSSVKSTAGTWQAGNFSGVTGATSLMATNGATFDFTGVQLELGTVASAFEQKQAGDVLRLCQREFEKSFLIGTAPAQNLGVNTGEQMFPAGVAAAATDIMYTEFVVNKRATPAITYFNPSAANAQVRDETAAADCSGTAASNNTDRGFLTTTTGNATTVAGNKLGFHYTADARL